MDKLLSASEIAALKLPSLPSTKVAIATRARNEGWYWEEVTGIGGTRRIYEVPTRYCRGNQGAEWTTLRSAGEIAALGLPGLERPRAEIIDIAEREGWKCEEHDTALGRRLLYQIPGKYLEGTMYAPPQAVKPTATIAAGGKADVKLLELAIRALNEWEKERGLQVSEERRPAVIALLYDHLQRSENGDLSLVLRALG